MKISRKAISLLLSCLMILSVFTVLPAAASAEAADTQSPELAQETVQGGAILHCFNWSYNEIASHLNEIAAAGYTAVQTSPVQPPKDYNSSWTDLSGQWWKLYQPLGLRVADGNSWLGTKSELRSLCAEADNYGIKVIVDIVANHLANKGSYGGTYDNLNENVDADLKKASYYHTDSEGISDADRYSITQKHMGQPDLKTQNESIQKNVLNLLKECVDCGVDGFRFDAAKHIELPESVDGNQFGGDFWPYVTEGIRKYCEQGNIPEPFLYGEVLGSAGPDTPISAYTQYMAVTDSNAGNSVLYNTVNDHVSSLVNGAYIENSGAQDCVIWAESHDTYMDGSTSQVSASDIIRAWAVVGSRADSTSLYLARPNSTMGYASSDTTWESEPVAEVNKFKNLFDGQSEYLSSQDKVFMNERGSKGAVIVLEDGGEVALNAHKLVDGTYTDHVSGSTFTVSDGLITGTVSTQYGAAVIYNANDIEDETVSSSDMLYLKPNTGSNSWSQGNERYAMYFYGTSGEAWVSLTDPDSDGYYGGSIPEGTWTAVIFCRMNGSTTANSWNNKWCQTGDLPIPAGYNCYTIDANVTQDTNPATGTWSAFGSSSESHAHTFGDPQWTWSSGFASAAATFYCGGCDSTVVVLDTNPATVTNNGVTYHTATVTLNGIAYSVGAQEYITGKLYLKPGAAWTADNARFAMFFYGLSGSAWADMTETADQGFYEGTIPQGDWTNVIFCRMNGSTTANNWDNKLAQTYDLYPTDQNLYTLSSYSGKASGTWGIYHNYGEPVWEWNDSYTSATATFTCGDCGNEYEVTDHTPTKEVTTPPTATADGVRSITATVQNPYGTSYTDTVEQSISKIGTRITGYNIGLWDEIAFKFYACIDDVTYSGFTASYSYGNNSNVPVQGKKIDPDEAYGFANYVFVIPVPAKSMTDTIEFNLKTSTGEPILDSSRDVCTYANDLHQIDDSYDDLLCAMLDYGASCQTYFNYHTDALAGLNSTIANINGNWRSPEADDQIDDDTAYSDDFVNGYKYVGAIMRTTSKTAINLYFETNDDAQGTAVTADVPGNGSYEVKFDPKYPDYTCIAITGIPAKNIFDDITIHFTKDGSPAGQMVYNAANYYNAVMTLNKNGAEGFTDELVTVMGRMYWYAYYAAEALKED